MNENCKHVFAPEQTMHCVRCLECGESKYMALASPGWWEHPKAIKPWWMLK